MALTAAETRATPYSLAFLLTRAGGAGTTLTISNAVLQAAAAAAGALTNGVIKTLLAAAYANTAAVQASLQGIGLTFSQAAQTPYCQVNTYQVSGTIGSGLAVAGTEAANLATFAIIAANVDAVYALELVQQHSSWA